MNLNKFIGIGNLTKDGQEFTAGENKVYKFSIAFNRFIPSTNGENKKKTLFLDAEIWGKRGEYLMSKTHKGSQVYVEGPLDAIAFKNKDGKEIRGIRLIIDKFDIFYDNTKKETVKTGTMSTDASDSGNPFEEL